MCLIIGGRNNGQALRLDSQARHGIIKHFLYPYTG
jgi:hypothetical protein